MSEYKESDWEYWKKQNLISLTSPLYREKSLNNDNIDTHFLTTFRKFLDFISILSVAFVFSIAVTHD